jgi:hypothetical protein
MQRRPVVRQDAPPQARTTTRSMIVPARGRQERALDVARLRYALLHPAALGPDRDLAYATWRRVWSETFDVLDGVRGLFSDDFTRQDEIGALFHDGECVGMTAFRWVDLAHTPAQEDSYFKPWPPHARSALLGLGRRVCIGSYLTVEQAWRGPCGPLSVKELLLAMAVERFLASDADVMAGTLRADRGMNGLGYRLGARPLACDVPHHGVGVDLVAFGRDARDAFQLTPLVEETVTALVTHALEEKPRTP